MDNVQRSSIMQRNGGSSAPSPGCPNTAASGCRCPELPSRFVVEPGPLSTPCHIWQGAVNGRGYGHFKRDGRDYRTHVVALLQSGVDIPAGMHVDHLCRIRRCCNPEHLEVVTQKENIRRGAQTKLTAAQVDEIRASLDSNRILGLRHGVDRSQISRIRSGKRWA